MYSTDRMLLGEVVLNPDVHIVVEEDGDEYQNTEIARL